MTVEIVAKFDDVVRTTVCRVYGHSIVSMVVEVHKDGSPDVFDVFCTKCGESLADIRADRD